MTFLAGFLSELLSGSECHLVKKTESVSKSVAIRQQLFTCLLQTGKALPQLIHIFFMESGRNKEQRTKNKGR